MCALLSRRLWPFSWSYNHLLVGFPRKRVTFGTVAAREYIRVVGNSVVPASSSWPLGLAGQTRHPDKFGKDWKEAGVRCVATHPQRCPTPDTGAVYPHTPCHRRHRHLSPLLPLGCSAFFCSCGCAPSPSKGRLCSVHQSRLPSGLSESIKVERPRSLSVIPLHPPVPVPEVPLGSVVAVEARKAEELERRKRALPKDLQRLCTGETRQFDGMQREADKCVLVAHHGATPHVRLSRSTKA